MIRGEGSFHCLYMNYNEISIYRGKQETEKFSDNFPGI